MIILSILCVLCVVRLYVATEKQNEDSPLTFLIYAAIPIVLISIFGMFFTNHIRIAKQQGFQEGLEQNWEYTIDTVWKHKKP